MYENIKKVGLPQWSDDDQTLAKALQKELKQPVRGLATKIAGTARAARRRRPPTATMAAEARAQPTGGGSRRYRRRLAGTCPR